VVGWKTAVQTKPIGPGRPEMGARRQGREALLRDRLRKTKPISRRASRIRCAKQSQSLQRVQRVKCFMGKGLWWIGHACETKPIGRWPPASRGESCETNPISGSQRAGPGVPLYKRTQFGAARSASEARLCKTKPISGSPAGAGERNVRNKAKLGRAGACGQVQWADLAGKWNVRNEPNSRRRRVGMREIQIRTSGSVRGEGG
jgi:hypothetical protein